MHHSDILITIAEIAGVLIGFTNLASIFEKSNVDKVLRQTNKIRLLIITEGGIISIFACLLPFLISAFNYSETIAFRTASLILAPIVIANAIFNFKRGAKLTGIPVLVQISGRPTQTRIGSVMILLNLCIVIPLVLIGTGRFDDAPIAGMYCLSVFVAFLGLCIFVVRFIRQVIS